MSARSPTKESEFILPARRIFGKAGSSGNVIESSRFRAVFGTTAGVCVTLWDAIGRQRPTECRQEHLLWALMYLKAYATEQVNSVICSVDEKTFRKWCWEFVFHLSNLNLVRPVFTFLLKSYSLTSMKIKWKTRLSGRSYDRCRIYVDGTDVRIYEPIPFSAKRYSHKFHTPGLRYEIGVGIETGHIVWAHGPFPCGKYSDAGIFLHSLKKQISPGECVVADGR